MNKKKSLLLMAVPLLFLLISIPLMNVSNLTFSFVKSVLETKTVTDVTSTSISLSNHYSVSAETSGFTDGSLFSLPYCFSIGF